MRAVRWIDSRMLAAASEADWEPKPAEPPSIDEAGAGARDILLALDGNGSSPDMRTASGSFPDVRKGTASGIGRLGLVGISTDSDGAVMLGLSLSATVPTSRGLPSLV